MTLMSNCLGLGHTAMKEFCGILGIPTMALKTFQKEWQVVRCTLEATGYVLNWSIAAVCVPYATTCNQTSLMTSPFPSLSFDGTAVLAISREIRVFPRTVGNTGKYWEISGNTGKYGNYVLTWLFNT